MHNLMLNLRLLRCSYSLTWHVFSLFDVNSTYVYTCVKQIYNTLFYIVDVVADRLLRICLSYILQYGNIPDLRNINFQTHLL